MIRSDAPRSLEWPRQWAIAIVEGTKSWADCPPEWVNIVRDHIESLAMGRISARIEAIARRIAGLPSRAARNKALERVKSDVRNAVQERAAAIFSERKRG